MKKYSSLFAAFVIAMVIFVLVGCGGGNNGGGTPPPPSPDFSLAATPETTSVVQGGSINVDINSSVLNGFTGQITLACTADDAGIAFACPSPFSVGAAQKATVKIGSAVTAKSHTLTFTATSGALSHSQTVAITVTAPDDFTLNCSVVGSGFFVKGLTQTVDCSTNSTVPVSLAVSGVPTGMSIANLPSSVTADQNAQGQITDNTAKAGDYSTISISGKSGTNSHTAALSVSVIDNGHQTVTVDPGLASSWPGLATFLAQAWPLMQSSCVSGGPSDNSTINVIYVPGQRPTYQPGGPGETPSSPEVIVGILPTTQDEAESLEPAIMHELSFAALNRLWGPPFGGTPYSLDEGYAQACEDIIVTKLNAQGVVVPFGSAVTAMQLFDTLRLLNRDQFLINGQPQNAILGEDAWLAYVTATQVPNGTTPGDWSQYNLSPALESLLSVYAAQGTSPTPAQLMSAFDQAAGSNKLDGAAPSAMFSKLADFDQNDPLVAGFHALCDSVPIIYPNVGGGFTVSCVSWETSSDLMHVTNTSVPVSIKLLDVNRKVLTGPISTTTNIMGFVIPSATGLDPGTYSIEASFNMNGTVQVQAIPFIVPRADVNPTGGPAYTYSTAPGDYFVHISSDGYADGGALTFSGGTPLWQIPGAAVVAPSQSTLPATITVNGQVVNHAGPWWRVYFVRN